MSSTESTDRLIGAMGADIKHLITRQEAVEKKLDEVISMTNRWKGATSLLIIIGGFMGWLANYFLRRA